MAAAPFSPGGKPVLIGKAHKLLWKQDIDLDVEVYKLQPVFGHMYCVHAVNVETAKPYPKLYVAYDSLKRILATKKIVDEKKAVFELLTTGMEVVTNTFTDGEGKEAGAAARSACGLMTVIGTRNRAPSPGDGEAEPPPPLGVTAWPSTSA